MAGRLCWQNFAHLVGTILFTSSEDLSFPKRWMQDPLRTMRSQSKVGWTVVASENDRVDLNEALAGDKLATIAAGYYSTGTAYATAIQTALNAVAVDNTYTVTYDATTHKLTIARATGSQNFTLEWFTGASAATRSAGRDMGFIVSADDGPGTTFTSDFAVYGSRQWWKFDLGSALGVNAVLLLGMNNLTINGLVRVQANASDVWTAPSYNQTFTSSSQVEDIGIHWPSSLQTFRWWRIVIDDPYFTGGYAAIGVPYIGSYFSPGDFQRGFANNPIGISEIQVGDAGGIFHDNKGQADSLELLCKLLSRAQRDAILQIYDAIGSKPLFLVLNDANLIDVRYFSLASVPQFTHIGGEDRYDVTFMFREQIQ